MKHKRVLAAMFAATIAGLFAIVAGSVPIAGSVLEGQAQAQTVAQSYMADSPLQAGMIVKLANDKSKVALANNTDNDKVYGVVVRPNDAPLSLTDNTASQEVYVATNGTYQVLVSDQNGGIKQGDYVVVSALEGIGMKVDGDSQYVIGKAVTNFMGSDISLTQTVVKDTAGRERTVKIGAIRVDVDVARNPLHKGAVSNVPGFMQKAADAIANKPVPPVRVYLGALVIIVAGFVVCSVLYAGIRTSIIALGRNPLARKSIFRNLLRVVLLGLIILVVAVFAVYLLVKL